MCGRFAQSLSASEYRDIVDAQLNREQRRQQSESSGSQSTRNASDRGNGTSKEAEKDAVPDLSLETRNEDYHPTFNVAPGTQVPIVRLAEAIPMKDTPSEKLDRRHLMVQTMRWGLLPHYTTSIPRGAEAMRTINARDDAVLSGRSMWTPILSSGKRCVVFCQGFYEWLKKEDGSQRIAHFVGMKYEGHGRVDVDGNKRALMPMAGLYEKCHIDGEEVYSFTVITTESNNQLNFLHDRMPVILPDAKSIQIWLGVVPAGSSEICSLLKPFSAGDLDVYPVPREVGKVGNNNASFILPVSSRKDGIAAAFGRVTNTQSSPSRKENQHDAANFDANSETNAPLGEELKGFAASEKDTRKAENDDEALARRLQRQEEKKAEWLQLRGGEAVSKDQKGMESNGSYCSEQEWQEPKKRKFEEESSASPAPLQTFDRSTPSSRFSPDPYNPPVSPMRPYGGYSTVDEHGQAHRTPNKTPMQAARSGGAGTGIETSPRSPVKAARRRQEERFKEAAKGSKDIRKFFG